MGRSGEKIVMNEEIPDTEQGLELYIDYCEKQMKSNLNHNERLRRRMEWCDEKLRTIRQSNGEDKRS